MNKILIGFLMLISSQAFAEWSYAGKNNYGELYVNRSSLQPGSTVWTLINLKTPFKGAIFSVASLVVADCNRLMMKSLTSIGYSEPMGYGRVVERDDKDYGWIFPVPDTLDERTLKIICRK